MTVFECDDTVNGIFTGIYDAWASRIGHRNVRLQIRGMNTPELFTEYRDVYPDADKAAKVARTIRRKMGREAYEMIYRAVLANDERKAECLYRMLVLGLSALVSEKEAAEMIWHLTNPDIHHIFKLSRKVWHEAHRYMGFVRFRELENGVLFSDIEAESNVLPLLSDHFADRFPNENFMIFDHGHRACLVHRAGMPCFILLDSEPDAEAKERLSAGEAEMQGLWREFCSSIAIDARKNNGLQQQLWPLKFRKFMTEGQ